MQCEYLEPCPFFNAKMSDKPKMTEMVKRKYCLTRPETCARFMVRKAGGTKECVPPDLYPMEAAKATELIAGLG